MRKPLQPILVLLLLMAIPFLVYAFIQIKSLDEDEKMAQVVYEKQMETVLFSLNQYADDMMNQWVRKLTDDQFSIHENADRLTLGHESIQMLILRDMTTLNDSIFYNDYVADTSGHINSKVQDWYSNQDSTLRKLKNYLDLGFQKIQPAVGWNSSEFNQTGITVMAYDRDSALYSALLILEPTYWVEQVLGNKMQEIDQDDFRLGVFRWVDKSDQHGIIYNTDPINFETSHIKKSLWILPDLYLVVQPKGESYADLISARYRNNLYFLLFASAVVLIGTFLVIRSIQNTLKIAQLKSDFVSNVSHEIRTPLTLIRMYAETLLLGRLTSDEKRKHYYQVIHNESGRLSYLVNNILDFSRIEANRKTYKLEELELNIEVERVKNNFLHFFKENEIMCDIKLTQSSIRIMADAPALEEALSNLIENAIKYSNGHKNIEIETYLSDGYGCCSVKDYGIGIHKKAHKNIFDKFYRVENALIQKTKGTGLGLSLVKHVMTSHDGDVTVESKPNHGSTFTLKFPLIK